MSALSTPRMLLEHNGSISLNINHYEPTVASGNPLLPTPTSLLVEGISEGLTYVNGDYHKTVEAVLDDELRVVLEQSEFTVADRRQDVVIERTWDGTDYEERVSVDDEEPVIGYRRTIDERTTEVMFNGNHYSVKRNNHVDGGYVWVTTQDDERYTTRVNEAGQVVYETHEKSNGDPNLRTRTFQYDDSGQLHKIVTSPGYVSIGKAYDMKPIDYVEFYNRQSDQLVFRSATAFGERSGNPETTETRHYGRSGEYQGSDLVQGTLDTGRLNLKTTASYLIQAAG
ncbi:MAG TPA: hypothetical protein VJC09_01120 [Candidatus Saccharimonadales bacterium]|nr:hypothetical protein [Candidatus Saccharimonadales bacterium]